MFVSGSLKESLVPQHFANSVGAMLEVSSSSHSVPDSTEKKHPNRKRMQKTAKKSQALESDRLNFLPWNQAVAGDEPLAFLSGGKEGGFLSLEEIDESEYGFIGGTQETSGRKKKKGSSATSSNSKKRKRGKSNAEAEEDVPFVVQEVHGANVKCVKKQNKRKNTIKTRKSKGLIAERETDCDSVEGNAEECNATNAESDIEEEPLLGEDEIYAWNDLRLHPLLLKSIRRLGFKEPTPIQKACIPIASHQGKDVIGAAQTGSGKTLAFGLPILQRLLEEREKSRRSLQNDIEVTVGSEKSFLRALILVPTRELALQVSDHLKKAAKDINICVVSIVGGMYSKKQERLLRRKPEIVVATPGRLWELMSGGNEHLVEVP
ncbi:DEAD-box ATP-dependent RNA helicase 13 [Platanthera zijinensis]|uniref:DEAD-box ATP-dependent RNA helicase 13 n=1 Tax=Platanthera zijinensis TaxID=2320716 RepID=A0AAP0BH04_9ASPA